MIWAQKWVGGSGCVAGANTKNILMGGFHSNIWLIL